VGVEVMGVWVLAKHVVLHVVSAHVVVHVVRVHVRVHVMRVRVQILHVRILPKHIVCVMRLPTTHVHLVGVHLMSMHLVGVHLMRVHFVGVHLEHVGVITRMHATRQITRVDHVPSMRIAREHMVVVVHVVRVGLSPHHVVRLLVSHHIVGSVAQRECRRLVE